METECNLVGKIVSAPAFYAERNIPKVRWMYPGKTYKARYMQVSYKYDEARLFIRVLNNEYVIAYRDEQFTREIGMLRLEHFQLIQQIDLKELPPYSSTFPIRMRYGHLLWDEGDIVHSFVARPLEPAQDASPVFEKEPQVEETIEEPIVQMVEQAMSEQLTLF